LPYLHFFPLDNDGNILKSQESSMPSMNLKNMDVDALLALRADLDRLLDQERRQLEQQLSRLRDGLRIDGAGQPSRRRTHSLKGRKVAAKYRAPTGETWAGRGMQPKWLTALIKQGRKLSDFAIERSANGRKRKGAARKSRKRK
jgi:DNA-binding protein H-NS